MKSPIKDKKIFAKIKKIRSIHPDTYYNEYPTQEELVEGNLVKKGDSRHYNLEIEVYSPRRYSFLRRRNPLSIFFPGSSTDSIALVFTLVLVLIIFLPTGVLLGYLVNFILKKIGREMQS